MRGAAKSQVARERAFGRLRMRDRESKVLPSVRISFSVNDYDSYPISTPILWSLRAREARRASLAKVEKKR